MMLRTPAAKRPRWSAFSPSLEAGHAMEASGIPVGAEEGLVHGSGELVQYELLGDGNVGFCEPYMDDNGVPDELCDWDSMRCSYKCRNMVKSELLETLDLREKQVVEYEAAIEALRRKLEATDCENQSLLGRVKSLEQSVAAAAAREKALRSQRLEETEQAEERFRKQLARCNELQAKLLEEIRLKSEAEAKARAIETEVSSLKDENRKLAADSSRKIQHLKEEVQHFQDDSECSLSRINLENEADRRRVDAIKEEHLQSQVQLFELRERLNQVTNQKLELEREVANAASQVSTTRATDSLEAEITIKSLREELNYYASEIAEAKKLKNSQVKMELLKEQLESERKRAGKAEAELADHIDIQLHISALKADLKAWEDMISRIPGDLSRDDVPRKVSELQRETLMTLSENGNLRSKIKELESVLEKANLERQEATRAAVAAREEAAEASEKASRFEHQVLRLTKERDGLKAVLASYDEEEALLLQQQKAASGAGPLATPEKSRQKRIEELENIVNDSQQALKSLEKELQSSMEATKEQHKRAEMLASELTKAESKISLLEREASQLRGEVGMLERKLACGEFNPIKTKVLKLRTSLEMQETAVSTVPLNTPVKDTHEQFTFMIENKQKIAMLTEKVGSLEQEISTLKKRENRYMQVFAEKAFTFRKACGLIFGYEILMNEKPDSAVTVFKLKSVYSRDKDNEILEFQYTAEGRSVGRIDMLANAYTTSPEIERQVTTFLQGFKSIPAFMANLTLELFNKVTIG